MARLHAHAERAEGALADALGSATGGGVQARLDAGQIIAVLRVLAQENRRHITAGRSADALHPEAVARSAFAQPEAGLPHLA